MEQGKASVAKKTPDYPEMPFLGRLELLFAIAATAMILLLVARVWLFFEPFRFPVVLSWQDAGIGTGIGLSITAISALVYRLWPAYRRSADFYLAFVLAPLVPLDSIWLGLLPGMSEELLFRGVILPAVGLDATGLVISSLCFGLLHMSGRGQWPYAVWASAVGLVLGGSVLVTGNLLVPVVAHVIANFVSSLFWQLRHPQVVS